jgi:hypothetical protein
MVETFFAGLVDLMCLPFFFLHFLLLTRLVIVIPETFALIKGIFNGDYDKSKGKYNNAVIRLRKTYFAELIEALIDIFIFVVSLPFVLMNVHLWSGFASGLSQSISNHSEEITRAERIRSILVDYRFLFITRIFQFFCDIGAGLGAILALMSPIRHNEFRCICVVKTGYRWCMQKPIEGFPIPEPEVNDSRPDEMDYLYNLELRLVCLRFGLLAFVDLCFAPFLLANLLLVARVHVVLPELYVLLKRATSCEISTLHHREEFDEHVMRVNWLYVKQIFSALIDILVFLVSFPCILMCVHLWPSYVAAVKTVIKIHWKVDPTTDIEARTDMRIAISENIRDVNLMKVIHFFIDIFAFPCILLCLMNPLRNGVFRRTCAQKAGASWCLMNKAQAEENASESAESAGSNSATQEQQAPRFTYANVSRPSQLDFMYNEELRQIAFAQSFNTLVDFVCFFFLLLNLMLITRLVIIIPEIVYLIKRSFRGDFEKANSEYNEALMRLNILYVTNFFNAILDLVCAVISLPFVIACVHLWPSYLEAIQGLKKLHDYDGELPIAIVSDRKDEIIMDLRVVSLTRIAHFAIDFFTAPFALLAVLSPLRSGIYRTTCAQQAGSAWCLCSSKSVEKEKDAAAEKKPEVVSEQEMQHSENENAARTADRVESFDTSPKYKPNCTNVDEVDFFYNLELRLISIYYGVIAMTDVLLFPFLIPLVLTWYRFKPVREKIVTSGKPYGLEEVFMIFFQFLLLTLDVFTAPVLLIVFVTRIRWRPLKEAYDEDDMCSMKSLDTYRVMFYQLFLLTLDLLVTPLAIFVILTYYRSDSVIYILKCKKRWHKEEFYFHRACLLETFIVFHDVLFMIPVILFLLVTVYRSVYTIRCLLEAIMYKAPEPASPAPSAPLPVQEAVIVEASAMPATSEVTVVEAVNDDKDEDPAAVEIGDGPVLWRAEVWMEFVGIIFDIPFLVIFFVGLATVWRANIFLRIAFESGQKDEKTSSFWSPPSALEKARRGPRHKQKKNAMMKQLVKLMVDIFFLVPFAIVVVTVYRLFSVIIQLVAKAMESQPLDLSSKENTPLLEIKNMDIQFPERGGPRLTIRAKPRDAKTGATSAPADAESGLPVSKPRLPRIVPNSVRMYVIGTDFWNAIEKKFGSTAAALGKGMLPLSLKDGEGIDAAGLSRPLEASSEGGEVEFWVQLDFKKTKRTTIEKNVHRLYLISVSDFRIFNINLY